jgi:hypothetical protein
LHQKEHGKTGRPGAHVISATDDIHRDIGIGVGTVIGVGVVFGNLLPSFCFISSHSLQLSYIILPILLILHDPTY